VIPLLVTHPFASVTSRQYPTNVKPVTLNVVPYVDVDPLNIKSPLHDV